MITVEQLCKTYRSPRKTGNFLKDVVTREYEDHIAVDGISFDIGENELIGFIGPNGAGKTTTLKMLSGILYPTSGKVTVMGYTPFEKDHRFLKRIGFVMGQKNQLLWDLPATDTFTVNKAIYEVGENEFKKTLSDLVEMLDAGSFLNQPVKTLSLGQRMRVELIASLLHRPKVLFLDEPTIGLDIFAQSAIRNFIRDYQEKYKATIILTSHYMQDVQQLAKRVILIDKGRIVFDDTLETLVATHSLDKIITLTLGKKQAALPSSITKLTYSYDHPQVRITVPKEDLPAVLSSVLKDIEYVDVTVENEAIEDVIKKSFGK
jgi:ABC-2 type transport system ATP-binding protein